MLDTLKNRLLTFAKSPVAYMWVKRAYFTAIFVIGFFTLYHIGYSNRIIPGVKIGDVFVGGMTYEEATAEFSERVKGLDPRIILTHEGIEHEITAEKISLQYNPEASAARAFEVGRSGNIFWDSKDKVASLVKTIRIKAIYNVNDALLSNEFAKIRGEINRLAVEPDFVIEQDGTLTISQPIIGKKVSDQGVYDLVVTAFDYLDFETREIPVVELEPELSVKDLEDVREEVAQIISQPIVVKSENRSWTVEPKQLLDFVKVEKKFLGSEVSLDGANFDSFEAMVAQEVDRLPRGEVTRIEDGVVVGFELTREGEELDRSKLSNDFEEVLFGEGSEVIASTTVIDSFDNPAKYGIYALLGEGKSEYTGSGAGRAFNLTLAAERTDGVLVPPGGIYSFNNSVGEISGATGYDTAYIISNGRTVLGEGGGVCQTSTTLFRAVLNSGLPVVTRHPHAYRVIYYELDQPVGFDASIYQPSLDFQFKNDTLNYVLVESSWDEEKQELYFRLYGTPDGREVSITEPVVTGQSPPPKPLYQDDPTLPKGVTKQVDFAAWGATSQFSRTVTRGDEVLHEDTFRTTYQPWRAIFLVGTKEES